MSSSGTLLSDLEGGSANFDQDNDLIKRIMADVNSGNANQQVLAPPAPAPPMSVISSPNPNSTLQHTMDNTPATAHIIGREHPSMGDFQDAIQNTAMPMMAPMPSGQQAQWQPVQQAMNVYVPPPKKWGSAIFDEVKLPIFVAIIVFVFSLPILNMIMANYLPSMVKPSGDLTTIGLLLKSLLAGATFWILQRIIVPLLSL